MFTISFRSGKGIPCDGRVYHCLRAYHNTGAQVQPPGVSPASTGPNRTLADKSAGFDSLVVRSLVGVVVVCVGVVGVGGDAAVIASSWLRMRI